MAQLPLEQAIPRFRQNEERVDTFVNGGPSSTFLTSTGTSVPSIQKFLADKNAEINVGAGSILTQVTAQANVSKDVGARFMTPKAADPTTRDDGTPLQGGDSYWNTTLGVMRTRVGSSFVNGTLSGTTPPQFDNGVNYATTAFVQRALGNFSEAYTIGGNVTLTVADAGKLVISALSSAATVTLPSFASVPAGATFTVSNTGTANVTVSGGGTNIDLGPANAASAVLAPSQSITVVRATGSSVWQTIGTPFNVNNSAAPLPTASVANGQWLTISPGAGIAAVLPAGGTWAWVLMRFNSGAFAAVNTGVSVGGTTIGSAVSGNLWVGFAWRIA